MTLTRRTPLRRTGRLPARRSEPRRSSFFTVPDYAEHLAAQPCAFGRYFHTAAHCHPVIQVHHQRAGAGAGLRRPDTHAMPACVTCHAQRHAHVGNFAGLGRDAVNGIEVILIAEQQRAWFGRRVDAEDLPTVRAAAEAGRATRGLLAASPITAGIAGHEAS